MNHSTHMCVYWKKYIWSPPPEPPAPITYSYVYILLCLKLYLFISMIISFWSPQDLIHLFMVFTICNARFPWPNFTTVLVVPFKLQIFQNSENHSKFVYEFLKTSEKSQRLFFFTTSLLLPKQEQCVNMKPIVLHIAFAWISLFLYCSFRKSPVFKERPLFLYVSPELF